jgi:hypothetical protein
MNKPPPKSPPTAVQQKMQKDWDGALGLLGRYFFGDETARQIAGLDPPAPAPPAPPAPEPLVTPPPSAASCAVCGTPSDGDIADRFIIRKDKKPIPCPGCLGRKS